MTSIFHNNLPAPTDEPDGLEKFLKGTQIAGKIAAIPLIRAPEVIALVQGGYKGFLAAQGVHADTYFAEIWGFGTLSIACGKAVDYDPIKPTPQRAAKYALIGAVELPALFAIGYGIGYASKIFS